MESFCVGFKEECSNYSYQSERTTAHQIGELHSSSSAPKRRGRPSKCAIVRKRVSLPAFLSGKRECPSGHTPEVGRATMRSEIFAMPGIGFSSAPNRGHLHFFLKGPDAMGS
ncbi:hypothetical protein CEXT_499591 [Caerostris extrusa]|uniref:Uncharacterized protein n=1 Tax=Caerostris extrusa TaxID=172846 RepID=A0AAV4YAQ5_CAEEX|nr:hypothetical protein CEXT_499591 [Caerostris extrusa]